MTEDELIRIAKMYQIKWREDYGINIDEPMVHDNERYQ